jgi:hypothetical protein
VAEDLAKEGGREGELRDEDRENTAVLSLAPPAEPTEPSLSRCRGSS